MGRTVSRTASSSFKNPKISLITLNKSNFFIFFLFRLTARISVKPLGHLYRSRRRRATTTSSSRDMNCMKLELPAILFTDMDYPSQLSSIVPAMTPSRDLWTQQLGKLHWPAILEWPSPALKQMTNPGAGDLNEPQRYTAGKKVVESSRYCAGVS